MANLLELNLDDLIAEAERELSLRREVYPRMVEKRRLPAIRADARMMLMEAIAATLRQVKEQRCPHCGKDWIPPL